MKFDYNIENYQVEELENIFDLPKGYDADIISSNEIKLRNSIMSDTTIDYEIKMQTLNFLNDAKNILLKNADNGPTLAVSEIKNKQSITSVPKYTVTHPSEFFPVVPNPVQPQTRTINVNIDTKYRPNYYTTQATNFTIVLPMQLNAVVSMSLGSLEMPKTAYFAITQAKGNNFIWLTVEPQTVKDPSGNDYICEGFSNIITVPDGTFTPDTVIDIMNKYLKSIPDNYDDQSGNLLQYVRFGVTSNTGNTGGSSNGSNQLMTYINLLNEPGSPGWNTGIYSEDNPRPLFNYIIDLQSGFSGQADYYTPLPLKLGWGLGFRNGVYINNSAYISEGIVNLDGAVYFYLCIDDFNNSSDGIYSILTDSILSKNILARNSIQSGSSLNYSGSTIVTTVRTYPGPVDIERLSIRMIDEYGRNLNLLNMDYSFVLSFTMNVGK